MKVKNIVLVGFMGTGKSTIARKLADRLGWNIIDTDQLVEKAEALSISEIFKSNGENYFRKVESKVIHEVMQRKKQVIATGGGAVLSDENRDIMLNNGLVVALKSDVKTIIERVSRDRNRPLLKGDVRKNVYELVEKRKHAYDFAHLQIDTSSSSMDEVLEEIIAYMNR